MVAVTRGGASVDDTLTGQSRRSASPDAVAVEMATVCRLCMRELRPPEPFATVCSSADCGATFHQECFCICELRDKRANTLPELSIASLQGRCIQSGVCGSWQNNAILL